MLDINEIKKLIPHRYPFLLVDKIIECDDESRIVGIKSVTMNEPFFQGHFPEYPIMPGVLIVEAMAQVACILGMRILKSEGRSSVFFYGDRQGQIPQTGSSRRRAAPGVDQSQATGRVVPV